LEFSEQNGQALNMELTFKLASNNELKFVLQLLKEAALRLQEKKIDQWNYWLVPPPSKIDWIKEGVDKNEFHFILLAEQIIGMFRLSIEDLLYWGREQVPAKYIHSFVISDRYTGKDIGAKVLELVGQKMIAEGVFMLRLDCLAANKKLCAYYERQDFSLIRKKELEGEWFNLYEKRLAP